MHGRSMEIEIKVHVQKPKPLLEFLKKNAKHIGRSRQVDQYFMPAHRNFVAARPIKEWLRLRKEKGGVSINYKCWHYDSKGVSRHADEYESGVEDARQLENIFNALNIKPLVKVDKTRDTWLYKNYEIGIDDVVGLGSFVEIELKTGSNNPKKIAEEMTEFLRKRGVGRIELNRQGYPMLLLFPNDAKYHEV